MEAYSDRKIPFGQKDDRLVGVSDVTSVLSCGCICPSCRFPLQANKGEKRKHYFSHHPIKDQPECKNAFETAIHLMAKQILAEFKEIALPSLMVSRSLVDIKGKKHTEQEEVVGNSIELFPKVKLEHKLGDIRPDIIGYAESSQLLIEIAVTHFSDSEKKRKIRDLGLAAIEIDLSKTDYTITESELRRLVVSKLDNKVWLSNPAAISVISKLETTLASKVREKNSEHERKRIAMQERVAAKHAAIRSTPREILSPVILYTPKKQCVLRWFCCEACHHAFQIPLHYAPYSKKTVPCVKCGFEVSTLPSK